MDEYLPEVYHNKNFMANKNGFEEYFEETFWDVWDNCVIESFKSIYTSLYKAITLNLIFGLITSFGLPEILFHWLSALCGVYMLLTTIQSIVGLTVIFASIILTYLVILIMKPLKECCEDWSEQKATSNNYYWHSTSFIQYCLITLFVLCEHILLEQGVWLEIRGVMMIFSMKLISVTTDWPLLKFPNFSEYCGYMFCSANVLFGPWITFEHYMIQVKFPTRKNFYWIFGVLKAFLYAIIFLTISNCWVNYLISEHSNSLLVGYKEALSFRTSHYFVCYLSEALMLSAGWKELNHHFDDEYWSFPITNFFKIEFPASLAVVVVNWNKPMHEFLKKHVYKKWLPSGKFKAVLLTFIMSSLFHGFELKVSTVLISLGVFSYLQILVREHISQVYNICVKVHPCKSCQHILKRDSIICRVTLLILSLFTVLHLIYLGVLMDQSTDEVGIYNKWNNLYFFSLWIMFINFLVVK